jgi:rhodanese-related sulfurtransferase
MKTLFTLVVGLMALSPLMAADVKPMDPKEAAALVQSGKAVLVDVREPSEWAETGVAAPAVLLPMSDFNGDRKLWKPFLEKNGDKQILLYCRSGARAGKVAAKLAEEGKSVANAGGFKAWADAGLPVTKPAVDPTSPAR